ncbi:SphA family protein [Cupriavidus oxalaticus]|uniref:Protein involved in meta-pathway of phenol degradation n=3 Tax=Cupriavidus oxalaticus TaxID=96344 RepID=A0A976BAJ9_9BURK|nr:transporter [Cupriavidus oxalaticus]WQD84485.1 transporter [Cupriavidus oxalaticus]SPC12417.1 Protein involved in meta-pathway of phenol degradation [Cupriavidus oxalaticus]
MEEDCMSVRMKAWTATTLVAASAACMATENGGSIYPHGAENYMTGALPPPGLYGQVFASHYRADRLMDGDGNRVPVDFSVRASAIAPRIVWVPGQKFLGGDIVLHAIAPLVDLKVGVNGSAQAKSGLGDMTFGTGIGYHYSPEWHVVYALDIYAPTGRYDRNDLANIGRNYWAVEPVIAISRVKPDGLNLDFKAMWAINTRNRDTGYRSGQELHADYAIGWGVSPHWVAGVGGYLYKQITDDKQDGQTLPGRRGQAFAIGPSVKYDSGKGWFLTLKWQKEFAVENRAAGDAFWLKAAFPLK